MSRKVMAVFTGAIITLLFVACGGGGSPDPYPSPSPSPSPGPQPPPTGSVTWDQVKAIINANCAKCHNGTTEPLLAPEAVFRASAAKAKLTAGAMPPPPNKISEADKAALLSFLQ